jgi:imidazolonepropionase-like amidohydrolase
MMPRALSLTLATTISLAVTAALAQTPQAEFSAPPGGARSFVIVSPAGRHGASYLWTRPDGTVVLRETGEVRGFGWDLEQTVRYGANGQPESIQVRGSTPWGDAAETFRIRDGRARWDTPSDSGSAPYDGRSQYLTHANNFIGIVPFLESLYAAPGRELSLLPGGRARLVELDEMRVGEGASKRSLTLHVVEGIDLAPVPVWMQGPAFFAYVDGMGLLPESSADLLPALQRTQDDALIARTAEIARRFAASNPGPVAFTGVRMFDADAGRFLANRTVVVRDGRIAAVGGADSVAVGDDVTVIDGAGRTLVPGLWDAHQHMGDGRNGPMLFSLGITSARDPGALPDQLVARNERIARGELLLPTVWSSIMIDVPGPLQAQVAVLVESAEEAVAAVRHAAEQGVSGLKFYSSTPPEWLAPTITEAKRLGMHVHGHVPATLRPMDAVVAGLEEITHINMVIMEAMPEEVVDGSNTVLRIEGPGRYAKDVDLTAEPMASLIQALAARRIVVDPTLTVFEATYTLDPGELPPAYVPFSGTMPTALERDLRLGGDQVPEDLTRADYRESFATLVALVGALHQAGVPIVAGTDGLGLRLVRELELYVQAGLTPAEALQTATIAPARVMGVDTETGSIAVGKEADLVLVEGDPSEDLGDLRHTRWVMSDGVLMNADELREAAGFAGRPREDIIHLELEGRFEGDRRSPR